MNLYSFISFITSVIVFFWGTFVFSKDIKNTAIRLFFIFSIITSYEASFEFMYMSSNSASDAQHWIKFHLLGWPILLLVQLHFLSVYGGFRFHKRKLFFVPLYIFTTILIVYLSFFNIYTTVINIDEGWIRVPVTFHSLQEFMFAAYLAIMSIATAFVGIRYRLKAKEKKDRLKANLILAGILTPTLVPFFKNGIFPGIFDISILFPDSPFIFCGWIFLIIAILYFRMFEITPKSASDNILSTMNEALILTDTDGKKVWANRRFYELFEFDSTELDQKIFDVLSEINAEAVKIIGDRYKEEELRNLVIPITTFKNNRIYASISSSFLRNDLHEIIGIVAIFNDISELIQTQQELKNQQQKMMEMAHQAGMSEVTTSVMHNIGNVLNSVNVSSELINMLLTSSKLPGLVKANELLLQHKDDLAYFLTNDPKGKLLPDYYSNLGAELKKEQKILKSESQNLFNKIKLIKDAIEIQQDYSRVRNLNEPINLNILLDEAVSIMEESFSKNDIRVQKEYASDKEIIVIAPASKLINVLMNIVKNAYESVKMNTKKERLITIKMIETESRFVQITITDNGIGIPKEVMPNIFKFGFTTKQTGHGYGLHFCANVLNEMNGSITAKSKGQGKGAEFIISVPKRQG